MKLAWRNLLADRFRFAVTIIGIAFAVFLMIFQGSLLAGFLQAAAKGVRATEGDLWVAARGVQCFEFPTPLPSRFREIALGVPDVLTAQRIIVGSAVWQKPSGVWQMVLLIGAETGVGKRFPVPYLREASAATVPESVLVDESNVQLLEAASLPVIEVNQRRAHTAKIISGFGSFFGTPYVFTTYGDAMKYLRTEPEQTSYLILKVNPGSDVQAMKQRVQQKLPEADVWTREEFARRAQIYWVAQTGAGGALLTAALLGFLVGLVVVSQNIYATTMEHLEEFATLKALGADSSYIQRLVLSQALICGFVGSCFGLLATLPTVSLARSAIPWVNTPFWLPISIIGVGLLMCALASIASIRKVLQLDPAKVFRA